MRGQVSIEVLGATVVIIGLLLFVTMTVQRQNLETVLFSESSLNLIQCNAIAETIANMHNNQAQSEQTLLVEIGARIQKIGEAGTIFVGDNYNSCRYVGSVTGEIVGVTLTEQTRYKFSKSNGEVAICEMPC